MSTFISLPYPQNGFNVWGIRRPDGSVPFFGFFDEAMAEGNASGWLFHQEQMYAWASLETGRVKFGRYALNTEGAEPIREIEYVSDAGLVPNQISTNRTPWTDEFNFITVVEDLGDSFHLLVLDTDLAVVIDRIYIPDFLQSETMPDTSRFTVVEKGDSSGFYIVAMEVGEQVGGLYPIRMNVVSLTATGEVQWAKQYMYDSEDSSPLLHALVLEDARLITALKETNGGDASSVLTLHERNGGLAWSTRVHGADLVLEHHQPTGTYPFASDELVWVAGGAEHPDQTGADHGLLLALDLNDGRIVRQVQFDADYPGQIGITRLTDDAIYLNRLEFSVPTSPPFQISFDSGLYRLNLDLDSMTGIELDNTDAAWLFATPTDDGQLQTRMGYQSRRESIVWKLSSELVPDCDSCDFFAPVGQVASPSNFMSTPLVPDWIDGDVNVSPGNSTLSDSSVNFVELSVVTEVVECRDVLPSLEVLPIENGTRALIRRNVAPGVSFNLRRSDDLSDFETILETGIGDGKVHPVFDTVSKGAGFWALEFN